MTPAKLSEATVRQLAVPKAATASPTLRDPNPGGDGAAGVWVSGSRPNGTRAFVLNFRIRGREHRFTIGAWPEWSVLKPIREARSRGNAASIVGRPVFRFASRRLKPPTSVAALDDFIARYARNPRQPLCQRTGDDYESMFRRLVKPRIGRLGNPDEIRRSHLIQMLDGLRR